MIDHAPTFESLITSPLVSQRLVEQWLVSFEKRWHVRVVIQDRYGVLGKDTEHSLVPEPYSRHRVPTCTKGRPPSDVPDRTAMEQCHRHCWMAVGDQFSAQSQHIRHSCWRGREEIVTAGFHQGEHLLNCFIGPASSGLPQNISAVLADAQSLLQSILNAAVNSDAADKDDRRVIIRRLLMKVETDPQLSDVANALEVSRHRASHIVQELFGQSWRQLRLTTRLRRATYLLQRRHLSINEIAKRCGWNDANGFIRQFRQHYGHSPHRWRCEHIMPSSTIHD